MGNIITQQCAIYQFRLEETKVNIYGEASEEKFYHPPVILYCLVERQNQQYPDSELGVDFSWNISFKFLRDDLVTANVVPEVGDIIMYQKGYYEIDDTNANQYFVGKNPDYPNKDDSGNNPLENDLENFGYNVSIICNTHNVPADKVGITKERF